jgi:hypothetical protein
MIQKYDPENWLLSVIRCIKEWTETGLNPDLFEIVMEFPGARFDEMKVPFSKSLVHFEVDSIDSSPLGMGDNAFADNYNAVDKTVNPQYAEMHVVNFDVGIWTADKSGGTTYRALLRQHLQNLFGVGAVTRRG